MNKKLRSLLVTFVLVATPAMAAMVEPAAVKIEGVQIGRGVDDAATKQFSIVLNFTNSGQEIKQWQLGFYMPLPLISSAAANYNPDLILQVCRADGSRCANLRYLKSRELAAPDLSQGYFTLLEPVTAFSLQAKQRYFIKIARINQTPPRNISSLPQNWFLIADDYSKNGVPRIYNINSEITDYQLLNYDHSQVEDKINDRINANWQASQVSSDGEVNLVPAPVAIMIESQAPAYTITRELKIHNQLASDSGVANYWAQTITADKSLATKASVDNVEDANDGIVISEISDPRILKNNPEGYRLTINQSGVTLEALTPAGVYYGLQTLRQLWQPSTRSLPAMTIVDYPRYKYRGLMLDVARHYFTVSQIKQLIDVMAAHKLNTLHLHLADDEAFRIALADYPGLTNVATRGLGQNLGPTMLLQSNLDITNRSAEIYPYANTSYGTSYSETELKDLIAYANANQITIIPEIDVPGHARALVKGLPAIMVDPNDNSQYVSIQGYTDNVLPVCTYGTSISVGEPFTAIFNQLITKIATLFNQQTTLYAAANELSLGGDEVSSLAWSNDSSCRDEWNGLTAEAKSHLFFQKVGESNPDLLISGWNQLIQNNDGSLSKQRLAAMQVGHVWVWAPSRNGVSQAISLANANYPTVLAYADQSYFDLAYTPSMYEPGFTWATSYMDTYAALSLATSAGQTEAKSSAPQNIVGIEGALWSENLASFDHLMYMALPKMAGLAEAAWSPQTQIINAGKLNWQNLAKRLGCGQQGFLAYLNQRFGVNYRGYPYGITQEVPISSVCQTSLDSGHNL